MVGRAAQIIAWHGIIVAIALGVLFAYIIVLSMILMIVWALS